jgi:hypothetical protein
MAKKKATRKFKVLNPYGHPEGTCIFQNERVGKFYDGDTFSWPDEKTNLLSETFIKTALRDGVIEEVR